MDGDGLELQVDDELFFLLEEKVQPVAFEGTIIDFETIGEFAQGPGLSKYRRLRPVSLGFLSGDILRVVALRGDSDTHFFEIKRVGKKMFEEVPRPFYAFNAEFEMGVCYWFFEEAVQFDRDLMFRIEDAAGNRRWEKKEYVVRNLGISNFDDPFHGEGRQVLSTWRKYIVTGKEEYLMEIVRHNRACLLKECGILQKRGKWRAAVAFQKPD